MRRMVNKPVVGDIVKLSEYWSIIAVSVERRMIGLESPSSLPRKKFTPVNRTQNFVNDRKKVAEAENLGLSLKGTGGRYFSEALITHTPTESSTDYHDVRDVLSAQDAFQAILYKQHSTGRRKLITPHTCLIFRIPTSEACIHVTI